MSIEPYNDLLERLRGERLRWLVTGAAGFIGSHLVERLLRLEQHVVGMDNFMTGKRENLGELRELLGPKAWRRLEFHEGDIRDLAACRRACANVDIVLHQAALGSVPRSLHDPLATHAANVDGFVNMLLAARDAGVRRFVFASSSSVYGDEPNLPKIEQRIGKPLSPYALSKLTNELYGDVFGRAYDMESVGLRYFNVFGARQDPEGPYAAVIPRWLRAMLEGAPVIINGDGETSRDFCYIDNAVQANLRAARSSNVRSGCAVFNVAVGERTTLNELVIRLREALSELASGIPPVTVQHADFRPGDVRHSLASIDKSSAVLGYLPTHRLVDGIRDAMPWYVAHARRYDLDQQGKSVAVKG